MKHSNANDFHQLPITVDDLPELFTYLADVRCVQCGRSALNHRDAAHDLIDPEMLT